MSSNLQISINWICCLIEESLSSQFQYQGLLGKELLQSLLYSTVCSANTPFPTFMTRRGKGPWRLFTSLWAFSLLLSEEFPYLPVLHLLSNFCYCGCLFSWSLTQIPGPLIFLLGIFSEATKIYRLPAMLFFLSNTKLFSTFLKFFYLQD